ncbi:MAG TPA: glycosyltransferase family 9 protein, partial [Casimicrobiaceae bacterium]|nr:glycosyltransferase family 9 protein [Casimicrobiaceae bacterium]
LSRRAAGPIERRPPAEGARILVAHQLLLGDTLMLTSLLAKLREQHPTADIVMALPEAYAPLYQRAPYAVRALGWDPRAPAASALWRERAFDVAFIPGDNRVSWLALALGSRSIVAFDGDRPARKSWPVDSKLRYPDTPAAWTDMVAMLSPGPPPHPYARRDWGDPDAAPFDLPQQRYAVLHVGASTALKRWQADRWRALAAWLGERGLVTVWSSGRGEEAIVRECDPAGRYRSYAGALSLPQLWRLLARAALVVAPDTGVAHLGRVVSTPTVALYGPGSALISGAGDFWRNAPFRAVTVDPFPCRDQPILFKREIAWVRRCGRSTAECPRPRCMDAIDLSMVQAAIAELGVAAD